MDTLMVKRGGSVNPKNYKDETFELLSIPSFDRGQTEIVAGREIGSSKKIVQPDDILLSKIVPHIRRCWVVPPARKLRQIASGEWIQFRSESVYPGYLKYFLVSDFFHRQFMNTVSGVGGSLLRASPSLVGKIRVPLPPLAEQKKIAAILDAADLLRQKDQQLIDNYTSLSQSLFLEMFGDPVSNKKDWELISLGNLCEFENGDRSSNYPSKSEVLMSGKLFLSSADIGSGYFAVKSSKFISPDKFDSLTRGKCRRGDVLMTLRGNGLGRTCVFECEYEEGFINAQMVILRPEISVCRSRFLVAQLNNEKVFSELLRYTSGSAQPQFSAADVKRFSVLLPPVSLQDMFVEQTDIIEQQKQQAKASLEKSEALFNCLLQQAFKGELTSSKAA